MVAIGFVIKESETISNDIREIIKIILWKLIYNIPLGTIQQ